MKKSLIFCALGFTFMIIMLMPNVASAQTVESELIGNQMLPESESALPADGTEILSEANFSEEETENTQQEIVEKEMPTTQSYVLKQSHIMDIPSLEGNVVGQMTSGQTVLVYTTDVNEEWNAIVGMGGELAYIHESAVEISAPAYEYLYMSDLTTLSGFSGQELELVLSGTGLSGLGEAFAQKELTHGVNALFLVAIAQYESAFGNSSLATGSNNLGGLKDGNGGYMSFETKEDCVDYMASLLKENYLEEDGRFYRGKTTKDVSYYYCEQSSTWYGQIESLMQTAAQKLA